MIIVLSPAKALDYQTPQTLHEHSQPLFIAESQILIDRLRELSPAELASLMKISDALAVLNVSRYAEWTQPFTLDNARQAILAFAGDVYAGLEATTLSVADRHFAQQHLRVLSGLYGVLRPLDLMQPYRLEMGSRLSNPRGKDLYAFWGDRISDALNDAVREAAAPVLLNLASEEYFKAVRPKNLTVPVIQPVFQDWGNGKFRVVSFFAKRARGLMARFAIINGLLEPAGLKDFTVAGYAYAADASSDSVWVFRRR
ncbi:peroxide stress protein YaaA [Candidatus Accumulibacter sp. ACC003]|uniref:peroxide stress protein YaaA n=1 Tax=Candidatus Accumulibacter sp. ACC003 TaxID=2823334 RepID=UPI0025B7D8EA|nr:peroxide stress protein YaaA [Candidatus Accumulibacter sp. ACC003]